VILFELLEWLGVGSSITTAAAIGLVALYARKGAKGLGFVAAVVGSGVSYPVASLVALAIALLRRAAKRAETEGRKSLSSGFADAVSDSATTEVHDRNVELLSTHQRLLYQIIPDASETEASELHHEYELQASSPKSRPTRRRYLDSLERYGLIEQEGSTRDSSYAAVRP
jgi:hypothetical protein